MVVDKKAGLVAPAMAKSVAVTVESVMGSSKLMCMASMKPSASRSKVSRPVMVGGVLSVLLMARAVAAQALSARS